MRRESILFKLNILFSLALIATLLAGFSFTMQSVKKEHMDMFFKSRLIIKEMRTSHEVPLVLLEEFDFTRIEGTLKKQILKKARENKLGTISVPRESEKPFLRFEKHVTVLTYKGHRYIYLKTRELQILLKDQRNVWSCCVTQIVVFLGIIILLIVMYILLRRSLLPLKKLQENIIKYGEGASIDPLFLDKKDEVSLASNAFYDSVKKVERLSDSRQLFIRNIFHELNTPVTKGKILAEVVEEPKTQEMLHSIFTRLSVLLKELAQMEKVTSQNFSIEPKPVRMQELIDEASDLLYLEENITTNVTDEIMNADFASMSIVFKNLIDNALKYGSDLRIDTIKNYIVFSSKGESLKQDLLYYTQAFSKGENIASDKGFGLGLYIVNEILSKHKMRLLYRYKEGINEFTIYFNNNF